jgi:hypothetical protein
MAYQSLGRATEGDQNYPIFLFGGSNPLGSANLIQKVRENKPRSFSLGSRTETASAASAGLAMTERELLVDCSPLGTHLCEQETRWSPQGPRAFATPGANDKVTAPRWSSHPRVTRWPRVQREGQRPEPTAPEAPFVPEPTG